MCKGIIMKNLICFISHIVTSEIVSLFKEISSGIPEDSEIVFISPTELDRRSEFSKISELTGGVTNLYLDKTEENLTDQNTYTFRSQLIFKNIYKLFPGYEYYYLIEYDVRFIGDWRSLFHHLSRLPEDLICSHFSMYNNIYEQGPYPRWKLRKMFSKEDRLIIDESGKITDDLYFSFLPFCRLSNSLMRLVYDYYETYDGFFEIVIPTICIKNDLSVIDLDHLGLTCPQLEIKEPDNFHLRCNSGSMSWYEEDKTVYDKPNILIHPIKPNLLR